MGYVNLPTPVAIAGGALCLLGGYLIGAVADPDTSSRTTAEVESYDARTDELCLVGEGIEGHEGVDDGELCGLWRRTGRSVPQKGDAFRFVTIESKSGENSSVFIYGAVVEE